MRSSKSIFSDIFGVALRGQTYLNAIYLLMSFPLGLIYFVFLITGISVGVPLVILWIGLAVLLGVFAVWVALIAFERKMAILLLDEDIPPMTRQDLTGKTLWQKFTATLANPVTWKGLLFLFAKLPLGLISFSVLVTLASLSVGLMAAPFFYTWAHPVIDLTLNGTIWTPVWVIDTLPEALFTCVVGIATALVSMHILNGLAWVNAKFARVMLGNFSAAPAVEVPALAG